jgi:hypothetical protein
MSVVMPATRCAAVALLDVWVRHDWSEGLQLDRLRELDEPPFQTRDSLYRMVLLDAPTVADSHQVVRGDREGKHPLHPLQPAMTQLSQPADRLQPAEDLFHTLTLLLTDQVPGWRVVRRSIALRRCALFWATCGVTFRRRKSATRAAVS